MRTQTIRLLGATNQNTVFLVLQTFRWRETR